MKRKGFTLVELLIVIAIIGVLASMMSLSSNEATIVAKAASIANGYRVIGTAYTLYHSVSGDESNTAYFNGTSSKDYLGSQTKNLGNFKVLSIDKSTAPETKVYVEYTFDKNNDGALQSRFLTYSKDMGMTQTSKNNAALTLRMRIY